MSQLALFSLESEPPMLRHLSDDEIRHFAEEPFKSDLPSNTQFLELLVQTVSGYGSAAADPKVRDGMVKAALYKMKSRSDGAGRHLICFFFLIGICSINFFLILFRVVL